MKHCPRLPIRSSTGWIILLAVLCAPGCGEQTRRDVEKERSIRLRGLEDGGDPGGDAGFSPEDESKLPPPLAPDSGLPGTPSDPSAPLQRDSGAADPAPPADPAESSALCNACQTQADCGEPDNYCLINRDTGETFCGQDCSTESCPGGYNCLIIEGATTVYQCVPFSESCLDQDSGDPGDNPGYQPPEGGVCGNTFESEVFNLVNQVRAQRGLSPLACLSSLTEVARGYSEFMCAAGFFSHTGADGSSFTDRLFAGGVSFSSGGENIAAGQPTPAEVMGAWMSSAGHRSNILDGAWTHLGVGYWACPKGYRHYWTQNFIRR